MSLIPPHGQLRDFLPADEHGDLLVWVMANQHRFTPATIKRDPAKPSMVDETARIALRLRDLGPLETVLRERLLDALPAVMAAAGAQEPAPRSLELELTAYGDGAFYGPHLDLPIGPDRKPLGANPGEDRLISGVYYFHARPKQFEGGELHLYPFGPGDGDDEAGMSIEPIDNSLAVFPSWARHAVRPVRCTSGNFADYRFALNCWYCRALG